MNQQVNDQGRLHNIPLQPTPFVGRAEEIGEISRLLEDPACRLLTLVGPGGIGKTRLAIESAVRTLTSFVQGIYFVPLQAVRTFDFLISAIADAVHFSLAGSDSTRDQLLNFLRDKNILLVLDNFEQLLPHAIIPTRDATKDGVNILTEILQTAPDAKLLVTSREVLNLQPEWVYAVEGMLYPRSTQVEAVESYSAVQLFLDRAHRVRREFSLADEHDNVVHICQLVEGMPLALELSASWIKTLGCAEIVAELRRNLNFLTTNFRDVPDRHKNMQAVFNYSWNMLAADEQKVFKRLSVFRGGFQRSAAEQVAGATLPILSALVDKSLLRSEANGRYQIHELLRQYAEKHLEQSTEESSRVHDLHCACFADFLHERLKDVNEGRQREAAIDTEAELENVRTAWQWAAQYGKVEQIRKSLGALIYFYQYQSRYLEGAAAFEAAARNLENQDRGKLRDLTLAELLTYQGWLCLRLGRLDTARKVIEKSREIYQRLDVPFAQRMGTDPRTALGILAVISGDYAKATRHGEQAYLTAQKQKNQWNMMFSLYVLTSTTLAQGDVQAARQYAQQAYVLAKEVNDSWFKAFILNDLGSAALALKEYGEAQGYFQASYAIRKEFDDPGGMADALNHLGKIAVLQEDYVEARGLFQESLSIYQEINDKGGLSTTHDGLGVVACATGDHQAAGEYFAEALQIAMDIKFLPLILSISINVGELWLQTEQLERGVELLAAVLHHPASDREAKEKAGQLIARCQTQLQPDLFKAARQRGQVSAQEGTFTTMLSDPVIVGHYAGDSPVLTSQHTHPPTQDLIEPLTPRELDVLRLIAEGLSNKGIAGRLVISLGTVKWYNNQIYSKLNVGSRTQAIARAGELRLLS